MNKRQARLFAIVSTGIAVFAFLALTVHSHTKFDELTNQKNNTPQVQSGRDVWHKYNCVNCHTLFGEGAYYAPDLTKITQLRGEQYLKAYMRDPSAFYDEQRHRRLMPKQERFVSEYLKDLNGAAAAVRTGYSLKTADRQAYALLRKPEISRVVGAAEKQRLEANKVSATRVIEENRRIGFNDPRRFIGPTAT